MSLGRCVLWTMLQKASLGDALLTDRPWTSVSDKDPDSMNPDPKPWTHRPRTFILGHTGRVRFDIAPTKRVGGGRGLKRNFFIFYNIHTFIHLITFIQYIYPSPFGKASLHFLIACLLSGETPPCGAKPRIELGPALQQADSLPAEPRRTIL